MEQSKANVSLTAEEQVEVNKINDMSHYDMANLWRHHEDYHIYFDINLPYYKFFEDRLFRQFGGFTPKISERVGW